MLVQPANASAMAQIEAERDNCSVIYKLVFDEEHPTKTYGEWPGHQQWVESGAACWAEGPHGSARFYLASSEASAEGWVNLSGYSGGAGGKHQFRTRWQVRLIHAWLDSVWMGFIPEISIGDESWERPCRTGNYGRDYKMFSGAWEALTEGLFGVREKLSSLPSVKHDGTCSLCCKLASLPEGT